MLNIWQIHSSYSSKSFSGENIYVERLHGLLSNNFESNKLCISTDSLLLSNKKKYTQGLRYLLLKDKHIIESVKKADLVVLHNTIPFISRETLSVILEKTKVLKVWHNARPNCIAGGFYREHGTCTACLDSKFGKFSSIINRCYRKSMPQSVIVQSVEQRNISLFKHPNMYHLAISEYIKGQIMTFGINQEKIITIPNFSQELEIVKEHGRDFIFVGRLDNAKGSAELITAWCLLSSQEKLARKLHIVGSPANQNWSEDIHELVENTDNEIIIHGELSHSEINLLANKCRTLIAPSQWEEAFGNVSIEALSMGLRLIVTPSGALSSLGDIPGVIVAEGKSSLAILNAIQKDLSSSEISPTTISKHWRLNYSVEIIEKKWNSHILKICSN